MPPEHASVSLPESLPSELLEAASEAPGLTDTVHVLLVEDDQADAVLVEDLLQDCDLSTRLTWVRSLAEARRALTGDDVPDCVLLDLHLGDAHGVSIVTRLLEWAPDAAVVVLTGLAEAQAGLAAETWRITYADPLLARVRQNGGPVKDLEIARGKESFDVLRRTWRTQNQDLEQAREQARAALAQARQMREWLLLAMLAAFLSVGVVLAMLLHFTVVRPLDALRVASRRVAAGYFSHPIPASGPVDVREVAHAVEAMRARIVLELDEATDRERLLREQAAELDAQAIELRRSNTELEQFAYVASHDLQEPLRKVASFCQMLERRYNDRLDDRGRQYIAFATDGARRMQALINDLLTFSRVGRMTSHRRALSLDEPLNQALSNLNGAVEAPGSAWPSARRSSSTTTGGSGSIPTTPTAPACTSP